MRTSWLGRSVEAPRTRKLFALITARRYAIIPNTYKRLDEKLLGMGADVARNVKLDASVTVRICGGQKLRGPLCFAKGIVR
jgi:hypothetical protein